MGDDSELKKEGDSHDDEVRRITEVLESVQVPQEMIGEVVEDVIHMLNYTPTKDAVSVRGISQMVLGHQKALKNPMHLQVMFCEWKV